MARVPRRPSGPWICWVVRPSEARRLADIAAVVYGGCVTWWAKLSAEPLRSCSRSPSKAPPARSIGPRRCAGTQVGSSHGFASLVGDAMGRHGGLDPVTRVHRRWAFGRKV